MEFRSEESKEAAAARLVGQAVSSLVQLGSIVIPARLLPNLLNRSDAGRRQKRLNTMSHLAKPLQGWAPSVSEEVVVGCVSCSPSRIRHREPNGSRGHLNQH
jgi:hypothetical protein